LELAKQPNFVVGTPGRLAELCRDGDGSGLYKPNFRKVRFVVLDEADRLLCAKSGFERDVAEVLLQSTTAVAAGEEAAVQDLVVQCDDDEVVEEFGGDGRCGCGEVAVDEGGGEAGW